MTLPLMRGALLAAVLFAGGCQTGGFYQAAPTPAPVPAASPLEGVWASTDGVFVANFSQGRFTSRFTATNEILAQGTYSMTGSVISMQWISAATKQQRSATCNFASAEAVNCNQDGGGHFTLKRSFEQPMPAPASASAAPLAAPMSVQ